MSDNRAWSWRHALLKSGLPATTRHVLLTISCFMNDVGGGCYPTQEQLAEATGLSDRAVRKHLEEAVAAGWLKRREHGFRGQKWRNHEYEASWPAQDVEAVAQHVDDGPERSSARFLEGAEPGAEGAEPDDKKVRNDVPTILPVKHSNQRSAGAREGANASEEFDQLVWSEFPRNPNSDRASALTAYIRLSPSERIACIRGVARVSLRFEETKSSEPLEQRLKYHPHLSTWIKSKGWEAELVAA